MFSSPDSTLSRALLSIFIFCLLLNTFASSSPTRLVGATLPPVNSTLDFLVSRTSNGLQRRIIHNETLEDRSVLLKRGCWPSKLAPHTSPPGTPPGTPVNEWICNVVIPGVDECAAKIDAKGNVGHKQSLFYTGVDGGQANCRRWASCNLDADTWVLWSSICDMQWYFSTTHAIERPFGPDGLNLPDDQQKARSDPFPKNLAQAFAEKSKGIVYLCIPHTVAPDDKSWNLNSAWGGWEYPALTRNKDVTEIWRVDPLDDQSEQGKKRKIWSAGNAQSATAPKGVRGPSLPAGLPQGFTPPDWQSQPDS